MRRLIVPSLVCFILPAVCLAADATDGLYSVKVIVTGKGERNRQLGFRECLDKVLVRVSGNQRVLAAPDLSSVREDPDGLIVSFSYRDRLEGVPIHDDQGSHDRPHDLTCNFDRARLDAVLIGLGSRPWLAERPVILPVVFIERGQKSFILTAGGGDWPFMDVAFAAAAEGLAMKVALPDLAIVAAGNGILSPLQTDMTELNRLASSVVDGAAPLAGHLAWSDADLGWVADWRIAFEGKIYVWQVRGVGFDEAFRVAMRGAAQVLSGNGQPP